MKITYWSDYACPYCYIGENYLKTAIKELGLEKELSVEMKAFELDPSASKRYTGKTVDRFAKKYGLSKDSAAQRIEHISQMGRDAGLDFRYAETRYTNTFDAHRLMKFAQSKGDEVAEKLQERLYHAYFAEEKELSDHAVLIRIATEEGLDEAEASDVLLSDKYADSVRLDEREAYNYGVSGVPFFLVAGKYSIPGALPVQEMKKVIEKVLAEEQQTNIPSPMHCGPDGCKFGE